MCIYIYIYVYCVYIYIYISICICIHRHELNLIACWLHCAGRRVIHRLSVGSALQIVRMQRCWLLDRKMARQRAGTQGGNGGRDGP